MEPPRWKAEHDSRRLFYSVIELSDRPDGKDMPAGDDEQALSREFAMVKDQWVIPCYADEEGTRSICACGKTGLREFYTIANSITGGELIVGNKCVDRFKSAELSAQAKSAKKAAKEKAAKVKKAAKAAAKAAEEKAETKAWLKAWNEGKAAKLQQCLDAGSLREIHIRTALMYRWITSTQAAGYKAEDSDYQKEVLSIVAGAFRGGAFFRLNTSTARHALTRYPGRGKGFGARKDEASGTWFWTGDLCFAPTEILQVVSVGAP